MRALALLPSYPTEQFPYFGIFHKTQLEALARRGLEIDAVAPVPWVPPGFERMSRKWRRYKETPLYQETAGVRVHRPRYLELPRGNHWAAPHLAYARCARTCIPSVPDLVHAQVAYPCGDAALRLARSWRVPFLLTLHGGDVNTFPFVNALNRRRFVRAVRSADAVIAVSESLAGITQRLTGKRPSVMPIGIDLRAFRALPAKSEARQVFGLPADRPIVLFVGNLLAEKGIRELMQALRILQADRALGVFVGDGPLRSEIASTPFARTLGFQPNARVAVLMAAADLLVLPSYSEGMPTVLIEAGAARLPVMASRIGGIPELVGADRGTLIEPHSVDEIVRGVRSALSDPAERMRRAKRLAELVDRDYDADKNAGALLGIYQELLWRSRQAASAV